MPPWNLRTRRVGGVCAEPGFYLCFLASQPCKTAAALWVKCMIPGIEMPLPEAELSHQPVRCCEGRAGQNVGCDVKAPVGPVAATTVSWVCAAQGAVPGQGLASAQTVVPVYGVGGHVSQGCLPWRWLSSRHLARPASWSMCIRVVLCPGEEHGLGVGQTLVCPMFGQEGVGSGH